MTLRNVLILPAILIAAQSCARLGVSPPPASGCPIVPIPKVYRPTGRTTGLHAAAFIVIGSKADETERYAADRLQSQIRHVTARTLPIAAEDALPGDAKQIFLLGRRSTNRLLDGLCKRDRIDLGPDSPGHDGFAIEVVQDAGREVILVGGSDARGVLYGQYALSDLMRAAAVVEGLAGG
ncbi:MAG TPA: alpha-glucuronidase family glycosyl hydrolase, partial [Sumerlaeia bacterium]|nr:alpha-glucuronidase family glycosyl hydrolase [Sumerlaeia bacterium]